MKTKIIIAGLLAIIMSSCSSPGYLPSSDKIDVNQNGSYINIMLKTTKGIYGELIAIDSNNIVVLSETTSKCQSVSINDVKRFKLQYAKPKHYGWTIPVGILLPLIHGWYSAITIPVHLIVTISVTSGGEKAFKYSEKNMTYDNLKMFARFPQGIPPNIDLASIQ